MTEILGHNITYKELCTMKYAIAFLLFLLSTFSAILHAQPVVRGPHTCTNASIAGPYGYTISGLVVNGDGSFTPDADSGTITSDGNGNLTGFDTDNLGGQIQSQTFTGTYTVNSDCRSSASITSNYGVVRNFNLVIVDNGQEILLIESDAGVVVSGSAKLQHTNCTPETISGPYGLAISGWTYDASGTGWGYAGSGKVLVDGAGGWSLQATANQGGTMANWTSSGQYSVNADCTGSATFTDAQDNPFHLNFVVLAGGREVQFIETDAGTTISGSAQQLFAPDQVLPQLAFGGGWYTALYFTNTSASAVSFPVSFVGDNGSPLSLPSVGGSSTTVNLAPRGTAIIEAPNVGQVAQGYAVVSLPDGIVGHGIFRSIVAGGNDQEAVVPLSAASTTTSTLIWDDTNFVTAVAVVNPSSVATTVSITVWDNSGNTIGTSSIALAAKSKTAAALRDLPGLAGVVGKRGSAEFTVNSGNVAVLGLRFNGAAFTSIPTADR